MKIGFIGGGNMATAILAGMVNSGAVNASDIGVFDADPTKSAALSERYGIRIFSDNPSLMQSSDIVFLCVKPQAAPGVLAGIKQYSGNDCRIASIVAGWSGEKLAASLNSGTKILRIMPNTPLLVGCGMSVFETPSTLDGEAYELVLRAFKSMGEVFSFDAALMDAVTSVSGCGPAFFYMFIDMIARAGADTGLDYDAALKLSAQTAKGAAEMILKTGVCPEQLTKNVCSPGGATIEGVNIIAASDVASVANSAVLAAKKRSEELG